MWPLLDLVGDEEEEVAMSDTDIVMSELKKDLDFELKRANELIPT